ncbi:hypothetical protein O6P43_011267 [Quillaja saponaria]|uniref:Uncharacterized protein n=1 Tax=Quillaja saponaria TaxID=32244 RepID=A0AAD7Q2D7_QUISA|nr:hypothetical protein O6P43_011267 [Quillaja saponaria]
METRSYFLTFILIQGLLLSHFGYMVIASTEKVSTLSSEKTASYDSSYKLRKMMLRRGRVGRVSPPPPPIPNFHIHFSPPPPLQPPPSQ